MKIQVRYLSKLAQVAGSMMEEFEVSEDTVVAQLLRYVAGSHGKLMHRFLYADDGAIMVSVLRNGRSVSSEEQLADGDEVTLMVLLSGG